MHKGKLTNINPPRITTEPPLSDNLGDIPFQILHSYNRSLITQK